MKRLCLHISVLVVSSCLLVAQQDSTTSRRPPTVAQVMSFFEVMHIKDQTQTVMQAQQKQMGVMMNDLFKKQLPNASSEQQARFEKLFNDAMNELIKNYPIDDVLRDMVPVYQAHLTEADLDQVIAFYSSPTGQRLLKEMPAMTQEAMRVSYARIEPELEKMMKNMQASIKQMVDDEKKSNGRSAAPAVPAK